MHELPHCTTAPMHQCMVISYASHGILNKELKRKPNLTYKGQLTTKHGRRDS